MQFAFFRSYGRTVHQSAGPRGILPFGMNAPSGSPRTERRRHRRFAPHNVRIWCVGGEFEEMYTTVNFARRLLNLSAKGLCVETTGRLRPDLKMSVEIRFDDVGGTLRSQARIIWTATVKVGAEEVHKAGLWFTGKQETTQAVRDYLEGGRADVIVAKRQAEYRELKQKSEARKEEAPKKGGFLKKAVVTLLLLTLVYAGSYWGFVAAGRIDSPDGRIHYRYPAAEETLEKVYSPLVWLLRKAGIDLAYGPP